LLIYIIEKHKRDNLKIKCKQNLKNIRIISKNVNQYKNKQCTVTMQYAL